MAQAPAHPPDYTPIPHHAWTSVLPKHEPCGQTTVGVIEAGSMRTRCTEIRSFARCNCERDPRKPTRGANNCDRCHGVGAVIKAVRAGCGKADVLCPYCGLRSWEGVPCIGCTPSAPAGAAS